MKCNITEEITINQADLDLSEASFEVFPQSLCKIHRNQVDSFHKFNTIPIFILPQSENIAATNGYH